MTASFAIPILKLFHRKENHIRNLNVFKSLSLPKEVKIAVLLLLIQLDVLRCRKYIMEKGMAVL